MQVLHGAVEEPAQTLPSCGKRTKALQGAVDRRRESPQFTSSGCPWPKLSLSTCQPAQPPLPLVQVQCPGSGVAARGSVMTITIFFHTPAQASSPESLALRVLWPAHSFQQNTGNPVKTWQVSCASWPDGACCRTMPVAMAQLHLQLAPESQPRIHK